MNALQKIRNTTAARATGKGTATTRQRPRRRFALAATVSALVAAAVLLSGAPANAAVNQAGPHTNYTWSTCTISVGDRPISPAWAEGDVQASCSTRHTIRSYVYLYRWNGAAWYLVESSNVLTWSNSYSSDNWTSAYRGGGSAYWQTVAYVSLDGGAYQQLAGPVAQYSPAA